jgi:hypothetical protein
VIRTPDPRWCAGGRCRRGPGLALALLLALLARPAAAAAGELAPRVASYGIDAVLDPQAREVSGSAVVRWRNPTRTPTDELFVHLYLNAFANNRTSLLTGMREAGERFLSRYPDAWGRIDLAAIHLGERDVTGDLQFVSPDDGNPHDRTLARLPLAKPVRPGETIELRFDFVARLPRLFMRAGHAAPFFFVAQWFPKLAVFKDGQWRAHQYHAVSEFFADFGTYDVRLTVPSAYVVGATGELRDEHDNGDGTKTVTVHADDVHDFAWTADPRFRVVEEHVGDVRVRLLVQPHHLDQAPRYLGALRAAIARYADWFGPYPYPVLTVVDPGPGGFGAAGMEYPMLITVGTAWWMPAGLRFPEMITVHEFGHQYWYGMVANDEVNEAWLDEGINSYVEGAIMDDTYGAEHSYVDLFGFGVGALALERFRYLAAGEWDPIDTPSFKMLDRDSYASTVYAKAALVLRTIDRALGDDRLRDALRAYFDTWRFRHPSSHDWRTLVDERAERTWRRSSRSSSTAPACSTTPWRASTCARCRRCARRPRTTPAAHPRPSRRATAARWWSNGAARCACRSTSSSPSTTAARRASRGTASTAGIGSTSPARARWRTRWSTRTTSCRSTSTG